MGAHQLILPTQNIVKRFEQSIATAPHLFGSPSEGKLSPTHPDQYMVDMMQYLEYDEERKIIDLTDQVYDRVHELALEFGSLESADTSACVISQAVYSFGRSYHGLLQRLDLYREMPGEDKLRFPYYYKGNVHGDIFVESYGDPIGRHAMNRRL